MRYKDMTINNTVNLKRKVHRQLLNRFRKYNKFHGNVYFDSAYILLCILHSKRGWDNGWISLNKKARSAMDASHQNEHINKFEIPLRNMRIEYFCDPIQWGDLIAYINGKDGYDEIYRRLNKIYDKNKEYYQKLNENKKELYEQKFNQHIDYLIST